MGVPRWRGRDVSPLTPGAADKYFIGTEASTENFRIWSTAIGRNAVYVRPDGQLVCTGGGVTSQMSPGDPTVNFFLSGTDGIGKGVIHWDAATNRTAINNVAVNTTVWYTDGINWGMSSGQAFKPGGGVWGDTSDARIKTVLGDYGGGLEQILALNPVRFVFRGNDTPAAPANADPQNHEPVAVPYENLDHHVAAVKRTEYVGLIAQDVEAVMPEMVSQRTRVPSTVRQPTTCELWIRVRWFAALINAVKELNG